MDPLKGSVSFQSVIDQNPEGWSKEAPEFKSNVADAFFNKHVASQPGFAQESPETQNQIRLEFNKKYDVGHVNLGEGWANDPINKAYGTVHDAIDLGTLGIPAKGWDAAKMDTENPLNASNTRDAELARFQNDPGVYGDLYRLSKTNPIKGIGGMAGMFAGANGFIQQAEKSGMGALATAATAGSKIAKPFLGTAGKAAGAIGATAWNTLTHGIAAERGQESPLQALLGLGLDTAALGVGGNGRVKNTLAQGGAGAVTSLLSNAIHGQKLDGWEALQNALMQAGVGAAFPHTTEPKRGPIKGLPLVKGAEQAMSVGKYGRDNLPSLSKEAKTARDMRTSVQGSLDQAARFRSISEAETLKAQISALKKQYENLSQAANHPQAPAQVRQQAQAMQAKILETHNQLNSAYQRKYGKPEKVQKVPLEHITRPEDIKALVGLVKQMRAEGNVKQADVAMGRFTPETKAKVYDEVKRQEGHDKARLTQAKADNKALNTAEKQAHQQEAKQLKGTIQARVKPVKVEAVKKERAPLLKKDFMPTHKMRETVREANQAGESVRIRYYAERTGETGEIEHKTLHDVKILEGKNGKETKWRGINADGQDHHYIERNNRGSLTDSNIIAVERTHEPVKFKREIHPETGNAHPVDVETGEFVPQVYKEGVKSSEIHSKIELLRKLDSGERVRPLEVLEAARQHEVSSMKEVTGNMSYPERSETYESVTERPC